MSICHSLLRVSAITCAAWLAAGSPARSVPPTVAPSSKLDWGDQGDGTFKNPILKADFADPDVIRVGDDFYLIGSDSQFVGIQVLHSKDLVNWQIIGQIFSRLTMAPAGGKYDSMHGYGEGTWAPAIRYHNGEFYVYVCTPEEGLFLWRAKNPAGPWSAAITVKSVAHWEDPCPFWDDDGRAYLVHSRVFAGPLILHRMSADGAKLMDDGKEIYRGPVAEGPKIYKRHGYYYISIPEGGIEGGGHVMLRSKNIYGPYEKKIVLKYGEPHQGGLVELPNGQAWFIAFKVAGWRGRECNLEPVMWGEDDWPIFGDQGRHVARTKMPDVGSAASLAPLRPEVNDAFNGPHLNPIWQWNHNPRDDSWSVNTPPGVLRLTAIPAVSLALARNTLTQKLWDDFGVIDVTLSTERLADGQTAGIAFQCGERFDWVGARREHGVRHVAAEFCPPPPGEGDKVGPPANPGRPPFAGPESSEVVHLRATYEQDGSGHLFFSFDGKSFTPIPGIATLRMANWKGARIALFSYGPTPGAANFSGFNYRYFSSREALTAATLAH